MSAASLCPDCRVPLVLTVDICEECESELEHCPGCDLVFCGCTDDEEE